MNEDVWYTAHTEPDNAEFLTDASELTQIFGGDGEGYGRGPEHGDEHDLVVLSKKYPGVALIIEAEGLEQGELWKEKYLDGKYYEKAIRFKWDEFEEKKPIQQKEK